MAREFKGGTSAIRYALGDSDDPFWKTFTGNTSHYRFWTRTLTAEEVRRYYEGHK